MKTLKSDSPAYRHWSGRCNERACRAGTFNSNEPDPHVGSYAVVEALLFAGEMPITWAMTRLGIAMRRGTAMSRAFINVMKAYHAPMTRESYLNFVYLGKPPVDDAGELPAELEAELPIQFQRGPMMQFAAIGVGKCGLCGNDGLLYDAGGVLYCERCERGFLESTEKWLTEDDYVFYVLKDGTVSDGDVKWPSVSALNMEHDITKCE